MKVTPLDLKKADFKRVLRGFDPDDVNELLAAAAETLEEMVRENRELKDKANRLDEQLKSYQSMEKTLNETLITAQKSGDATRQAAEREAELIVAKAEVQAEKLVEEAKSELKRIRYQIEMMEHEKEAYLVKMRSLVASQWKLLQEDFEPKKRKDFEKAGAIVDQADPAPEAPQGAPGQAPSGGNFEQVLAEEQAESEGEEEILSGDILDDESGESGDVGDLSDKLSKILGSQADSGSTVDDDEGSDSDQFFLGDEGEGGQAGEDTGEQSAGQDGKKEKPEVFWGDDEPQDEQQEEVSEDKE